MTEQSTAEPTEAQRASLEKYLPLCEVKQSQCLRYGDCPACELPMLGKPGSLLIVHTEQRTEWVCKPCIQAARQIWRARQGL